MQIMVGHPNAHGRVFLSQQLPARDGVAVFVSDPFAQSELDDAKQQGRNAKPKDAVPVAFAVEEDKMDGLTQGEEQGDCPKVEGQTFVTAQDFVGFGLPELQGKSHDER